MRQVSSRICSIAWTSDGNLLALGCFDGSVLIRDKAGTEKTRIETGTSPVWAVAWNPSVRAGFIASFTANEVLILGSRDIRDTAGWLWF